MINVFSQKKYKKIAWLHVLAIFFIILDRLLKIWALKVKPSGNSWLSWHYSLNSNLAFSLPSQPTVTLIITSVIIIYLWFYYFKLIKTGQWLAGLVFAIILGALSNLFDRLIYGGVIDYFNFASLTIFNLADALITLSLSWWIFREIFYTNGSATIAPDDKI